MERHEQRDSIAKPGLLVRSIQLRYGGITMVEAIELASTLLFFEQGRRHDSTASVPRASSYPEAEHCLQR